MPAAALPTAAEAAALARLVADINAAELPARVRELVLSNIRTVVSRRATGYRFRSMISHTRQFLDDVARIRRTTRSYTRVGSGRGGARRGR